MSVGAVAGGPGWDQAPPDRGPVAMSGLLGRWVLLAAVTAALIATGSGALERPAVWHGRAWAAKVASDGAFVGTVAVVHGALVVVGAYLLLLCSAAVLARVFSLGLRRQGLAPRFLLRISLPGTRWLVAWTVGLAALSGPLASAPPSSAATVGGSAAPTMIRLGPGMAPSGSHPVVGTGGAGMSAPTGTTTPPSAAAAPSTAAAAPTGTTTPPSAAVAPSTAAAAPTGTTTPPSAAAAAPTGTAPGPSGSGPSCVVGPGTTTPPAASEAPAGAASSATVPGETATPTPTSAGTWRVAPGDHLWSIASATLTAAWGYTPSVHDIGAYWWQVVTANRASLPDPTDIDLLFAGDVVTLPPVPPAPTPPAPAVVPGGG